MKKELAKVEKWLNPFHENYPHDQINEVEFRKYLAFFLHTYDNLSLIDVNYSTTMWEFRRQDIHERIFKLCKIYCSQELDEIKKEKLKQDLKEMEDNINS